MEKTEFTTSANFITNHIQAFLSDIGVSENWIKILNLIIVLVAAILIVYLLQKITKTIVTFAFKKIEKVTGLSIFSHARNNRLPHFLALVIPYSFIISAIPTIFADYHAAIKPAIKLTDIYMVFMVIWTIMAIIRTLADLIQERPAFQNKPMKSYLQIIQIILFIFGAVVIYSVLTGKSATAFFAAMGAASAVLMLMFKDTIMGFVGSIQISTNNMVQIGDWITMSKYGADGTVEEVTLTTVKVRNFDKTITTIPTYSLISDSFQNWRGMQESGGRRIKRALVIKQSDIRNLTNEELAVYEKTEALAGYIKQKKEEYGTLNKNLKIDEASLLNGFQITNCDLFICYAIWYLKNNPNIHQDMTLMVRELAPTSSGLPIEVYTFTNTTVWAEYERIMCEVFNHLIYNVKVFGLTIYESSSSSDSLTVNLHQLDKFDKMRESGITEEKK
ncbi:mechanosensitive ion channel family protein [Dysgonomonas macrotermitis]|uniref:Mechanosensing system component YbdG n=1 Tax=Dysgonomonas macrotermitis TaxID=1346286 RepID=A0A1M5FAS6_9BACT|nr:mechanosensitive ion channel domain-containing protein [Dysgonomonas macrotermitis]SHF88617.1 miniconductance mechanosensitive channel [Dysgonomonas macrotermitis]